jgi:hypothetical protein
MGDQLPIAVLQLLAHEAEVDMVINQLTATDDSPVPDHPVESSRTGIQSARADPS